MSKPKLITIYRDDSINYCGGSLQKLLNEITEKFNQLVPEEYRENAKVEINTDSTYDDSYEARLCVCFERLETPEEVLKRINAEEAQLKYKRQMFLRLKKELGEE